MKIRFVDPDKEKKKSRSRKEELHAALEGSSETQEQAHPNIDSSKSQQPDEATVVPASPDASLRMDWLRAFSWRHNPFNDFDATPARAFIVGRSEARTACNLFVLRQGRFGIIRGEDGTGRSMLLKWLSEELASHEQAFRVIQKKMPVLVDELTTELVVPYKGFFSKYRGSSPEDLAEYLDSREKRRIAILLDDADALGDLEPVLRALLAKGKTIVVLAGRHPPELQEPHVTVTLGQLKPDEAVEVVRKRINSVGGREFAPFTHDELLQLWSSSRANLTEFLDSCEHLAMSYAVKPAHSATEESIRSAAKDQAESSDSKEEVKRTEFDSLIEGLVDSKQSHPSHQQSTHNAKKKKHK